LKKTDFYGFLSANKTDNFIDLRLNIKMLLEILKPKKIKNVCVVFWLPCLPCEKGVK